MKKETYLGTIIVIFIDLLTKFLAIKYLTKEISIINNFFSLIFVKNTGGAFSLFSSYTYVLAIIGIIVLIYINKSCIKDNMSKILSYSMILLMGGISGNLIDRVINGYVIDFLSFKIFNYNFPIFNIADIAICLGAFIFIIESVKEGKK